MSTNSNNQREFAKSLGSAQSKRGGKPPERNGEKRSCKCGAEISMYNLEDECHRCGTPKSLKALRSLFY